jgi:hypothetical protein
MRIVKSEWHQVEKRYELIINRDTVDEVYPDNTEEENDEIYSQLESGELSWDEFEDTARELDVWFDWDWLDEDDWWTDRKGGYEITYEVESDYEPPK